MAGEPARRLGYDCIRVISSTVTLSGMSGSRSTQLYVNFIYVSPDSSLYSRNNLLHLIGEPARSLATSPIIIYCKIIWGE